MKLFLLLISFIYSHGEIFFTVEDAIKKEELINAFEADKKNLKNCIALGSFYLHIEMYIFAEEIFNHCHGLDGKNWEVSYGLAQAVDKISEEKEIVLQLFKNALELNPLQSEIYQKVLDLQIYLGKNLDAIGTITTLKEIDPIQGGKQQATLCDLFIAEMFYREALNCYNALLSKNKEDATVYYRIGNIYDMLKDYKKSISNYIEAVALDQNYYEAFHNMAFVYDKLGEYESAILNYKKCIELKPEGSHSYNGIGMVFEKMKLHDLARENYLKALELQSDYEASLINLGYMERSLGEYKTSVGLFLRVLEINPKNIKILNELAEMYNLAGNMTRAKVFYEQAIRAIDNGNGVSFYNYAYALMKNKEIEQAVEILKKGVEEDELFRENYVALGYIFSQQGKLELSLKVFQDLVVVYPADHDAIYNIGLIMHQLKNYNEAIKAFSRTIRLSPNDTNVYYSLALVYKDMGENDKAFKTLEKIIELKPDEKIVNYLLGEILVEQNNIGLAEKYLREELNINPDHEDSIFMLAGIYHERNDIPSTVTLYKKVISLNEKNYQAFYNLGVVYHQTSDLLKAMENYIKCLKLKPEFSFAHMNLALLFKELDDDEKAMAHYEKAVELNIELKNEELLEELKKPHEELFNVDIEVEGYEKDKRMEKEEKEGKKKEKTGKEEGEEEEIIIENVNTDL